jgi:hypothetical protein
MLSVAREGAVPPAQFVPVVHVDVPAPPLHVYVAYWLEIVMILSSVAWAVVVEPFQEMPRLPDEMLKGLASLSPEIVVVPRVIGSGETEITAVLLPFA